MAANKRATCVAILLLPSACSGGSPEPAEDLVEWSRANPPVSAQTWATVDELQCVPHSLDVCSQHDCQPKIIDQEPPVIVVWNPSTGEYRRCDRTGGNCDTYQSETHYSGSFANVVVPAHASVFRITASGEYREIANLLRTTLIYRGQCTRASASNQ